MTTTTTSTFRRPVLAAMLPALLLSGCAREAVATAPTRTAQPVAQASATPAPATTVTTAAPALWAVRDADTTIYLFGTVHLLRPDIGWFDGAVARAFAASDELTMELADPDGPETVKAVMARAQATDGRTLASRLTPAQAERLGRFLATYNMPAAALDPLQPWMAGLTVAMLPLIAKGFKPEAGVEAVLRKAALDKGKTISGLETPAQQIGFLADLPEKDQIDLLISSLDGGEQQAAMIDRLVTDWAAGNADGVGSTINAAMAPYPRLAATLLTDRNARWADTIKARLDRPGTVFVAVGAGHLAGPGSVQEMLAKRGVTVQRIDR